MSESRKMALLQRNRRLRFFIRRSRSVGRLALSTFREIFDESAYARFLAHNAMTSCPASYGLFLREQESLKARRPKCC